MTFYFEDPEKPAKNVNSCVLKKENNFNLFTHAWLMYMRLKYFNFNLLRLSYALKKSIPIIKKSFPS